MKCMALLKVDNLKTYFHTRNGIVKAVNGISYSLEKGETMGIVGESGSGKSVSCYSLLGLLPTPPAKIESGTAEFMGVDLLACSFDELQKIRGNTITMIFQDPMTCLNPYLKVGFQLIEPLLIHRKISRFDAEKKALAALKEVGILDCQKRMNQYPHEFSGGMRQRIMIAMALITEPKLLIADEPTTALDVTIQAQILELIKKLQRNYGAAVIFITHDLGVIAGIADKVAVMYGGRIMEQGDTRQIYYNPRHPYTRALIGSIPASHKPGEELYTIPGQPPDMSKPIPGCPFEQRCAEAFQECNKQVPPLVSVGNNQFCACVRAAELFASSVTHDSKKDVGA
ncbi:MAG: ABC transporter ATP-binding protein [Chitinivibrionales bacterium]|nr:ABC transporter ATP-binding protein [Chitinivibrionales bacterium]